MHVILLLVFLFALYRAPKTTLGFTALLIGAVVYFGAIKNPQGNLAPELITKWGLEKKYDGPAGKANGGICWVSPDPADNTDPECFPNAAKAAAPSAGPTPVKPIPGTAGKVY